MNTFNLTALFIVHACMDKSHSSPELREPTELEESEEPMELQEPEELLEPSKPEELEEPKKMHA